MGNQERGDGMIPAEREAPTICKTSTDENISAEIDSKFVQLNNGVRLVLNASRAEPTEKNQRVVALGLTKLEKALQDLHDIETRLNDCCCELRRKLSPGVALGLDDAMRCEEAAMQLGRTVDVLQALQLLRQDAE